MSLRSARRARQLSVRALNEEPAGTADAHKPVRRRQNSLSFVRWRARHLLLDNNLRVLHRAKVGVLPRLCGTPDQGAKLKLCRRKRLAPECADTPWTKLSKHREL